MHQPPTCAVAAISPAEAVHGGVPPARPLVARFGSRQARAGCFGG